MLRGMKVDDPAYAERCLRRVGYYRLSAYWYPFRKKCPDPRCIDKEFICDEFSSGTTFEEIWSFYLFDKQLRLHLTDALERIEIYIRALTVEVLGARGPYAHRDSRSYNGWFTKIGEDGVSKLEEFVAGQDRAFQRSKEDFSKHFRKTYFGPPPIWIAAGAWDWGNLTYVVSGMSDANKKKLCSMIHPNLANRTLTSWLSSLNEVRNTCAHHSRLWNKALTNSPSFQKQGDFPEFNHLWLENGSLADSQTKRLYGALVATVWLMKKVHPKTEWHYRLVDIVKTAPKNNRISAKVAGFPDNWRKEQIWS